MADEWYYAKGDEEHGPVSSLELKQLAAEGKLQPTDLVWKEGVTDWKPASIVKGLFNEPTPGPPPPIPPSPPPLVDQSSTSQGKALLAAVASKTKQLHSKAAQAAKDVQTNLKNPAITATRNAKEEEAVTTSGDGQNPTRPPSRLKRPGLSMRADLRIELTKRIRKAVADCNAIIPHPEIPENELKGAMGYAPLQDGEQPLCLHDSTILGSGTEGVLLSARGVYWHNPNTANGENAKGFLAYEDIKSGDVTANYGGKFFGERSIQLSRDDRVRFGAIDEPGLKRLASFIVHAAQLAQLKFAEEKIEAGDHADAIQMLRDVVQKDTCLVPDVAPLVERIVQADSGLEEGKTLDQEIKSKTADRSAWWFVRCADAEVVSGPNDLAELQQQFHSGRLFTDDGVKHFSDGGFTQVGEVAPFSESGTTYFRDTGTYDPEAYAEACSLAHEALGDNLVIFFNSGGGKTPVIHIGMTDEELVVVHADSEGKLEASQDTFESATCAFDEARENLTLATRDVNFELPLVTSSGLSALIERSSQIMFERAKVSFAEKQYFTADKLSRQIADPSVVQEELDNMTAEMGVVAELIAVYDGGHPDFPEKVIVAVRLDAHGLELSPVIPGAEFYDRVPYGDVLDVLPPVRGQMPDELAEELAKSKRNAGIFKLGLGMAAASVIPGGGMLMSGLMGKGKQTAAPTNRICIVLVIDGSRYRLFFDAFGGSDTETLNELAKTFWSNAISVQNKFNKPGPKPKAGAGTAITSAEAKSQTALLREIRDMLGELVSTNQLREQGHLLKAGILTQEEFETRKSRLLSTKPSTPGKPDTAVVGCPKCSIKLRAGEPGVVQCPKCSTKVRVAESFFPGRRQSEEKADAAS